MVFQLPDRCRSSYDPVTTNAWEGLADKEFREAAGIAPGADPLSLLSLPGARKAKDSRNLLVEAFVGDESRRRKVWIKLYRPRGAAAWVKRALGAGKAERAWNAAFQLLEAGIDTPRPLLGLRGRGAFGRLRGLLVVEDAGAAEPLRSLLGKLDEHSGERRALVEALGGFLRQMHGKGFGHRDLSGGNLLVRRGSGGQCAFALIDIGRMRQSPRISARQRLRDLERIRLAEGDWPVFLKAYCQGDAALERVGAACLRRARQYQRMRQARTPVGRIAGKLKYYWANITGI